HKNVGTWYAVGLGSCGVSNVATDLVVAVSEQLYDTYPGYTGTNPNNNPVCGKKIQATYQGKSVTVTVTDRCTGCTLTDLDFSQGAFDKLAAESAGRLHGVTWTWV
ncbi:plant expansin, partial [Coniophora puteana RWD-64-598 SS2]